MSNELANLDKARTLLAQARTLEDVKKIHDMAEAARAYAKAAKLGQEAIDYATEIKLLSERKLGQMLKVSEKNKGGRPQKTPTQQVGVFQSLKALGLTYNESSRAQFLADLPEPKFCAILHRDKSVHQIRREMRIEQNMKPIPLPEGKFDVLYADPPWEYKNSGFPGSAETHYATMPTSEICQLPIQSLLGKEAALLLWATNPMLKDALRVVEDWGFEYKTNFVWTKDSPYAGFHNLGQHELLLIATKGTFLPQKLYPSVLDFKKTRHSKKPEEVYGIIEGMYPNRKYMELFAREAREHWSSWGNEIGRQDRSDSETDVRQGLDGRPHKTLARP